MKMAKVVRVLRGTFLALSLCSLYFVPWPIVRVWLSPIPDSLQEQVDQGRDFGFDGIIAYVDDSKNSPATFVAGWHDPRGEVPAYSDALFKIASIRKLYTAVAIARLAHKGRLPLESCLSEHYPELVGRIENAERITVKMMVQHRSGIMNYAGSPEYWIDPKELDEERLALVLDAPAQFEPGSSSEYSNTSYLLLRGIIARTVGYSYARYVQEQILAPLSLSDTFPSLEGVDESRVMSGYHGGNPLDLKHQKQGMLATAQNVGLFLKALNEGELLTPQEQALYDSLYRREHTGLVPGYQSIARYDKESGIVVVLFTSPSDFDGYNWNLAELLAGRILKIARRKQQRS